MSKLGEKLKVLLGLAGSSSQTTMKPTAVLSAVGAQITKISSGHTPMIRFRKALPQMNMSPTATGTGGAHKGQSPSSPSGGGGSNQVIEEWQLPQRFRRRPLDPNEIAYINRGGPE